MVMVRISLLLLQSYYNTLLKQFVFTIITSTHYNNIYFTNFMPYTVCRLILKNTTKRLHTDMEDELNEANTEHISAVHSEEKTEPCCKPSYQIRKLRNKGAIIILVWNFLMINAYNFLEESTSVPYAKDIGMVAFGLTLPLAGWLTDVYLGRHKVIRWSIWIMWIGSMLATASSIIAQLVENYNKINHIISFVVVLAIAIGFGGYQANIIQFGLDQLQDASTIEITAFIRWYIWTIFSSQVVFTKKCFEQYYLLGMIIVCTCITVVISAFFILNSELVKEPTTQNPFKLIYKVMQYAIKHKHPRCRSAFTYCEDELPSRIDFGKSKYGGPFTVEQVEDVKTFLRLLVATAIASIIASIIITLHRLEYKLIKAFLHNPSNILIMKECYRETFLTSTIECLAVALLIPLYEFIIYPTTHRLVPSVKIYQKFILGVVLQIVTVIILMVFDSTVIKAHQEHNINSTIHCILTYDQGALSSNYDGTSKWIILAQLLGTISRAIVCISGLEFLVSQTPYTMRGLLFGVTYGSALIFTLIGSGTFHLITQGSSTWGTGVISCEFWYLFSLLFVLIIFSGLLLIVGRWYKNRKREDVLPNEHIFAERYYSQMQ